MLQRRIVWVCPNGCSTTDVTERADVHQQLHPCRAMGGLTVPLVEQGMRVKVSVHEREDFLGDEVVTTDENGRPIMAVSIIRDDGEDRVVFAPLAVGEHNE
jgi:hypothetical protein